MRLRSFLCVVWLWGCGSAAQRVEPTLATGTRVADTLGVVVRYLCDQGEQRAVQAATSFANYEDGVTKVRQVCDPVVDAYDALAEAQLATVDALGVLERCQASGASCLVELGQMSAALTHALTAASAAQAAAQGAVLVLEQDAQGAFE